MFQFIIIYKYLNQVISLSKSLTLAKTSRVLFPCKNWLLISLRKLCYLYHIELDRIGKNEPLRINDFTTQNDDSE
mgnify:CR=1 FL=1